MLQVLTKVTDLVQQKLKLLHTSNNHFCCNEFLHMQLA